MLEHWHDFFLAQVGASAALAGLIFVGVSINLKDIVASSNLVDLALKSVLDLMLVLLVASLLLAPALPVALLGACLTLLALVRSGIFVALVRRSWPLTLPAYRRFAWWQNVLSLSVSLPFLLGGLALLWAGSWGPDVLALGVLVSICVAIRNAWVLLIEILR